MGSGERQRTSGNIGNHLLDKEFMKITGVGFPFPL
jgi:hypothetical protein